MADELDLTDLANAAEEHTLTAVGLVGGVWAVRKVVGPSLDVIGSALGRFTERRIENLQGLADKLAARLNSEEVPSLEPEASVHPRIARLIVDEASWIDDETTQEYLAGMLLSSARPGGREGHDLYLANIVARLSPDHLRLHHAIYAAYLGAGGGLTFALDDQARKMGMSAPLEDVAPVVPLRWLSAATTGLHREGFIQYFSSKGPEHGPHPDWPWAMAPGIVATPTLLGARLFMSAYGLTDEPPDSLLRMSALPLVSTDMPRFSTTRLDPRMFESEPSEDKQAD